MPMRLPSDPREGVVYLRGYYDAKSDYEVPKTGKWIKHDNELLGLTYECSVCHIEGMLHTPFCPICGTRMVDENE